MPMFKITHHRIFTLTDGRSVSAIKGTIVRPTKRGRIILVELTQKKGSRNVVSNKERPTTTYLVDIKSDIQLVSE